MGMLRIRLARFGCKNRPFYRLVAIDSEKPRQAKPIEYLGTYDPIPYGLDTTKEIRLRMDRIKYWLSVGAQPSDRCSYLLWRAGLLPAPPIHFTPTRWTPKKVLREQAKKKFHSMTDAQLELISGTASSSTAAAAPSSSSTTASFSTAGFGRSIPSASSSSSSFSAFSTSSRLSSFSGMFSRPAPAFMMR